MTHTMQDDFEHFLTYSGNHKQHVDVRSLMWKAFEAGHEPAHDYREAAEKLAGLVLEHRQYMHLCAPLIDAAEMVRLAEIVKAQPGTMTHTDSGDGVHVKWSPDA